ncbi:class A beta-lactamase [Ruegeria atlantica]|uniref:class A beta-lactamase n=1 Tax=Ruegeria atlantica TaxID=81569 RepID=UPI00147E2152|nr:class A beta-lactamase [Ruegeria atlantica]
MRGLRIITTNFLFSITLIFGPVMSVQAQSLTETVRTWEDRLDARIGALLYEPGSDWQVSYRADELFPMSSTFKTLLCGAVLAKVDAGSERLSDTVTYQSSDLVDYSPLTSKHVETGMSVGALCEATMTISDNTAANLLLQRLDGPAGLTGFLRTIGDDVTRLDRWETALNEATPGDPRDTTTPHAILATLDRLLFGEALSVTSSAQLKQWMIEDQVADELIRAHVPDGWTIGDKTGAGGHGSRAIVAFLQTPEPRTYLAAIYLTESDAPFPERNAVLSDVGRAMIAEISARSD